MQKNMLSTGIDEQASKLGLERLPSETLNEFQNRFELMSRFLLADKLPVLSIPGLMIGELDIPVIRISLLEAVSVKVTNSKLVVGDNEISLLDREDGYFLEDVLTFLEAQTSIETSELPGYTQYFRSKQLRLENNLNGRSVQLYKSNENFLGRRFIRDIQFSNIEVFQNQVADIDDLDADGDFFIDYEEGIVISTLVQNGSATYTYYKDVVLSYQNVQVKSLNSEDINDLLFEDRDGTEVLNMYGNSLYNEIYNNTTLEWGK
jgi:hypothetical protein